MDTPICDFINEYAESDPLRLHMPGHKGRGDIEALDITEIDGADSLYEADGIIKKSEQNAGALFGCDTFYSTEGCSHCIRAMLYLTVLYAKERGKRPVIAAYRNVHKTFLSAAALLDLEIEWLHGNGTESYLACKTDAAALDDFLKNADQMPTAVYITTPDYLGNMSDVRSLASVCHSYGVLLIVDGAHGAYLQFLNPSQHPISLGADICCDSGHKTLPILTGGAYLHISGSAPTAFAKQAKDALMMFGSTSPSYLILRSLDAANAYVADGYPQRLSEFIKKTDSLKTRLAQNGFCLTGDEPLKITLLTKSYGYTGTEFAEKLQKKNIVCEFADPDFLVLMLTPETGETGIERLESALLSVPRREEIAQKPPAVCKCERVMSVREAAMSPFEELPVEKSVGRVLASASVGCPPAVPIVICGERIDENAVSALQYYGRKTCNVTK